MIKQIPEQELSFKEALEIVINEAEVSAIGNRDDTQLQVLKAVEVVKQFSTYLPDSFNNDALPQKVSTIEPTDFSKDWNKMVDFHTSRPGHDLRYALDGGLMKELGWVPKVSIEDRINEVVQWTLNNDRWLKV